MINLSTLFELASLDAHENHQEKLLKDVESIMDFVEQLKLEDTTHISPMFHPHPMVQPLREDVLTEQEHLDELAKLCADFEDNLYWVPQVIDSGEA